MSENRTVRASFGIELSVRTSTGGRVKVTEVLEDDAPDGATQWSATCTPATSPCALGVPLTVQSVTLTAIANDGYHLESWAGACAGTAATENCTVTLNAGVANPGKTVSATFDEDPPPSAPTGLMATGGNTEIRLTWNDPNNPTITKYEVRSRLSGATVQGSWSEIEGSGATTTSHTLDGLTNGSEYTVQVRAVSASGNGVESTVTATPTAPPRPTPPTPTGRACLDPNQFGVNTSWRQVCASTTASALTSILDDDGACGLWLWRDEMWVGYFRNSDGVLAPGSENFTIVAGDTLFVRSALRAVTARSSFPPPPPIPPQVVAAADAPHARRA